MYMRFYILIDSREHSALQNLADDEMRPFREQARWLLREALIERGYLSREPSDTGDQNQPATKPISQ